MANRPPSLDSQCFSVSDLERYGSKKLQRTYRDFYNGGAMDLITLRDNVAAYDRYKIWPRALRNVSNVDTSGELMGSKTTFPLGISPSAMQQLAHPDGELATSRAAANVGIAMCLSSYSNTPLEAVRREGKENPYMMQMCIVRDRKVTKQLLERAEAAGYKAIFISVDVPVLGRRLNEYRNNFSLPENLGFPNILSSGQEEFNKSDGPNNYDDSLDWTEILPWLKNNTKMEVWLKGILNPEDIELAIRYRADGVVISNHGGRQLDHAPATLDALRLCAPIARGRIPIIVDGGIRRGSDIFKAIALGAQHCFVGRLAIWGLAYNGQKGVELGLKLLLEEFRITMALAGCASVKEITPDRITFLDSTGRLAKL